MSRRFHPYGIWGKPVSRAQCRHGWEWFVRSIHCEDLMTNSDLGRLASSGRVFGTMFLARIRFGRFVMYMISITGDYKQSSQSLQGTLGPSIPRSVSGCFTDRSQSSRDTAMADQCVLQQLCTTHQILDSRILVRIKTSSTTLHDSCRTGLSPV